MEHAYFATFGMFSTPNVWPVCSPLATRERGARGGRRSRGGCGHHHGGKWERGEEGSSIESGEARGILNMAVLNVGVCTHIFTEPAPSLSSGSGDGRLGRVMASSDGVSAQRLSCLDWPIA